MILNFSFFFFFSLEGSLVILNDSHNYKPTEVRK